MVIRPSLASAASYKLLNTKIMLNHVVFTKMMVGICCPSLIFFYDVTFTPLAFLGGGDTALAQL